MGWLTDLTNWLAEQIAAFFNALESLLTDLLVMWLEQTCTMVLWVLDHIPLPDWVSTYSLCNLLAQTGPTVTWALDTFRVGEALGLVAAGYGFRLLRKVVTLFQW